MAYTASQLENQIINLLGLLGALSAAQKNRGLTVQERADAARYAKWIGIWNDKYKRLTGQFYGGRRTPIFIRQPTPEEVEQAAREAAEAQVQQQKDLTLRDIADLKIRCDLQAARLAGLVQTKRRHIVNNIVRGMLVTLAGGVSFSGLSLIEIKRIKPAQAKLLAVGAALKQRDLVAAQHHLREAM